MSGAMRAVACASVLAAMAGCAGHHQEFETVRIPPRIDLAQHEMIGVVDFSSKDAGKLGPIATRKFQEWARRDQGLIRIVSCGSRSEALRSIGRDRWDEQAYQALGRARGVQTILMGEVKVSNVRPDVRISASLRSGEATGQVDATLDVQLIEAATGASLWSASSRSTTTLAHIGVFGGKSFAFDADDPDRAYGALVDDLVEQVTRDFRASYEQRPVVAPARSM